MADRGRRSWSALTVVLATAVTATLAVLYPGFATADVELNDGGVWVTRSVDLRVGHLNYASRVLDGSALTRTADFDLLQDGNDVITYDNGLGSLTQLDPAKVEFLGDGSLTEGSRVALRSGTIGVIDAANDGLYVLKPVAVPGFSVAGRDPIAELGPGSAVTVGIGGTVHAVSPERAELVSVKGEYGEPEVRSLDGIQAGAKLSITAVGDTAVVLDSANGVVYTAERTIPLPEARGGRLQGAGAASDRVVITTSAGLVSQPLDGGEPTVVRIVPGGDPAQPVVVNGCAYGVWSGTAAYVRDCPGEDADRNEILPDAGNQPQLTLRQNRNAVVVNELAHGLTWLVEQDLAKVDNWEDVIPPPEQTGDEQSQETRTQFTLPKRSPENNPPTAEDDDYGVRAGSTAVLAVLENDTDPDGDLLSASLVGQAPANVQVQPVSAGAALQVTAGPNAAGTITFRYRVDDGREGGTDEARVTLRIRPFGQNEAPRQKKVHTVLLEAGATATYDALMGWFDPDGDDLYLKRAWNDQGDRVTYRSNGVIQFTEATGERGIHEVKLLVSDGSAEFQGLLRVDVRAKGSLAPVANADRYATLAGDPITIAPLANDLSTSGKQLRLAKLDPVAGTKIVPDFTAGTFSFEAAAAGTYYVQYLVTDGPNAASGIVRVDVKAAGATGLAPLATRDVALLPPSREVLVDVLANDTDPTGGILVVQSVTLPPGSPVSAELLEHRVLRVRDVGGLNAPTTIGYRVSNGDQWADGEVRVIPVALPEDQQAPVTTDDRALVRAGDIVTVDVTANDYHPSGDAIELLDELKEIPDPADGVAFVSEGKVRFRAGPDEKTVALVYEVTDSDQNVTAGYVRIQIIAPDADNNGAPLPRSVTARAIAGASVRIPIPLDGIDPDGDSVELLGTATAARKGRVSVGDTWLVYEAYPGTTGRDSFDYLVRDRLGATATGTAVVGIAAPSNQNQPPYTVRDEVQVRPGRSVSVPVLQNDSDPDGDDVGLVSSLTVPDGLTAEVVKSRVLVRAPDTEGDYSIIYTAVDEFGARTQGTLIVTVSAEAPLRAPIARDDRVQPVQLGGEPTVDVAVLDNDEDPDGVAEDLEVTTDEPNATVQTDGVLTVTLAPQPQVILYTVTDVDAQSASAAVFVPGTDSMLPTLKTTEPIEVAAGEQLRIPLVDHVAVRSGRTPRVAEAESIRAGHAAGGSLLVDETTLSYTSAADYFGPDAVSVQVTDGTGPDDPEGNTAYLSIPILVLPGRNQPPSFLDTSVSVAPGEEPAELNLRKLASDPDPGDADRLTFDVSTVPAGFEARLDGDRLFISADAGTAQGTRAEVAVAVSDGTNRPTTGRITVLVTSSQRPLPVAVDDVIPRAEQGRPVRVDVLANDSNPFPDTPLTVIATEVVTGRGTAAVDGSRVVVTPDEGFVGTLRATYRIQDATRSRDREAEATISVTVQGRPDRPTKPIVVTVGDRSVVLQWAPPPNNGRPITGYTVSSKGFSQQCASTTCTLKGLTNDVEYTFTVVATNEIGDSDPSPPSAVARPDTRPDTPAAPQLEFGDRSLGVSWRTPNSSGSPVLSYNLEISPAPESGPMQLTGITGNSYVWKGLRNGTAYQVRVQAVNRAPEPSEWSQYSRAEVPAGPPQAPGRPTTEPATPVGSQAQIRVSWPAVTGDAANGDPVREYTLRVIHGGSSSSIKVNGTSQNITVDPSTSDYTFQVVATNKAGNSSPSPASAARRAAVPPDAPRNVTAEPGDGRLRLTFSAGNLNGSRASEITWHYRVNQTGGSGTISSGSWISGLTNGTRYTVDVWATSSVAGVEPGPRATSTAATPFGKPIITLDGIDRLDNAVRFRWRVNNNGSSLTSEDPGISGGSGSRTVSGLSAGEETSITVRYGNAAGTTSATWSGRANDPPPMSATVSHGASAQGQPGCSTAACRYLVVNTANFPAGTYNYQCWGSHGGNFSSGSRSFPANGSIQLPCYYGYGGTQVRVEIVGVITTPNITW